MLHASLTCAEVEFVMPETLAYIFLDGRLILRLSRSVIKEHSEPESMSARAEKSVPLRRIFTRAVPKSTPEFVFA